MQKLWNDGWEFAEVPLDTSYSDVPEDLWQPVRLPHDFLITDAKALYRDATGWYRKTFTCKEEGIDPSLHTFLNFDGVYMDCRVYCNGAEIAEWKYGYSAFTVDLTDHLIPDAQTPPRQSDEAIGNPQDQDVNELLVCVRHQSPNTRWYSGAGIFRDVTLIQKNLTWIPVNGVYFHAEEVKEKNSPLFEITIQTEIDGTEAAEVTVRQTLLDPEGNPVPLKPVFTAELWKKAPDIQGNEPVGGILPFLPAAPKKIRVLEQRYLVEGIRRWDIPRTFRVYPETAQAGNAEETPVEAGTADAAAAGPVLYRLKTELVENGDVLDTEEIRVGFRTVTFDTERGFFLNGRHFKLNGVCEHHDLGALGAAFDRQAYRRKLLRLREMGVNAVRLTHNMAAKGVLELADELGFLLISEAFDMWERPKTEYDYARFFKKWHTRDVESWIRRDRNHPSVILWSIGNEIYDTHADKRGVTITADLKAQVELHDPFQNARATIGSNYMPWEGAQRCADVLKIAGYNYAEKFYEKHHAEHPDWVIYGSETASIVQSRGVYHFPLSVGSIAEEDEQCSSLGNSCTSWGAHSFEECAGIDRDLPFSLGQFLWSGFDYIGEPTPYHTKNSYFGQIDTAGFPKDAYYFWQSVWTDPNEKPMIHIIPHYWDFNEDQQIDVRVVSNLDQVELFLNGKSLGRQTLTHAPGSGLKLFADYRVAYIPGKLTAVACDEDGREVVRETLRTCGDTAEIRVTEEDFSTLSSSAPAGDGAAETPANTASSEAAGKLHFYRIEAFDRDGNPVGNAADRVHVSVEGGTLVGLDNGDSTDEENYQSSTRRLFNGKLLAVVREDPEADGGGSAIRLTVIRDAHDVPVRKLRIDAVDGCAFSDTKKSLFARVRVLPVQATDQQVEVRAVTDTGVITNLVTVDHTELRPDGMTDIMMTAKGDGHFRLRAVSKSGTGKPRVLSELEYRIEGVGTAYLDPYGFVSGSLYTSSIGEVGSGNEKGIVSARDGRTVITWENLDFGRDVADTVTLPIFTLNDDPYRIRIWEGIPGDENHSGSDRQDRAILLVDGIYQKPSIWNVYQEETWELAKPLTGLTTISIEVEQKFHIKGFSFHRIPRAFARLRTVEADALYGDMYRREADAICDIGNNVTITFTDMDFGETGARTVRLTGRGRQTNSIHLCFKDENGQELRQLVEFPASADYTEQTFALKDLPEGVITGKQQVDLVFLPGTALDLKDIQFIEM